MTQDLVRARAGLVACAVALLGLGASACGQATGAAQAPRPTRTAPVPVTTVRVADLPGGRPPAVDHVAGRELRWHGRTLRTDLPEGVDLTLLGSVGGRVLGVADDVGGSAADQRFWTVDGSGHAQQVGGAYQSLDYAPALVESTGHLWVHQEDRSTPRTIWELDAATGREVAAYRDDRVPHGLAPADQALVDAWVSRRVSVPATSGRSPGGLLVASTSSAPVGAGASASTVVVRRGSGGTVLRRLRFPDVSRLVFEDDRHVLVRTTVSPGGRADHGDRQAVVRCPVPEGQCELAGTAGGFVSLGVDRSRFRPGR